MIVYYDATRDLIYAERTQRVWPARSLVAVQSQTDDTVMIAMATSLVPVLGPLSPGMVQRADGTAFTDQASALAYLQGEFARYATPALRNYSVVVSTSGQSVIPISPMPVDINTVSLFVNGASYAPPDIVVSSIAVTWQGPFALEPSDILRVTYF